MSENKSNKVKNTDENEVIYPKNNSSISSSVSKNSTTHNNSVTNSTIDTKTAYNKDLIDRIASKIKTSNSSITYNKEVKPIDFQHAFSTIHERNNSTINTIIDNLKNSDLSTNYNKKTFSKIDGIDEILKNKTERIEQNLLNKQKIALDAIEKKLSDATTDIDKHKSDTNSELKETRNSVLGTIALFAAFFTFVSVNVNIFTKAENVTQSLIFMLSFWLCIVGFISLFFLFLNKNINTKIHKTIEFITTVCCVLLSGLLMYFLFNHSDQSSYKKLNDSLTTIQDENKKLKEENEVLNKKITNKLALLDEQVLELRKNQYQLNQSH
ncbi:hypothetical protein [Acinetobacter dispersus]|uniref:hypothetical protein n=1 Tax=Acinetobacter dispersus TaxID=70348 RepID=UPI00132F042D|nr:hypothetical protein [Acinetobacter dispersus]QHH97524.1 hypothetical protein FPL17_08125 [Acinetobacter dispersus]